MARQSGDRLGGKGGCASAGPLPAAPKRPRPAPPAPPRALALTHSQSMSQDRSHSALIGTTTSPSGRYHGRVGRLCVIRVGGRSVWGTFSTYSDGSLPGPPWWLPIDAEVSPQGRGGCRVMRLFPRWAWGGGCVMQEFPRRPGVVAERCGCFPIASVWGRGRGGTWPFRGGREGPRRRAPTLARQSVAHWLLVGGFRSVWPGRAGVWGDFVLNTRLAAQSGECSVRIAADVSPQARGGCRTVRLFPHYAAVPAGLCRSFPDRGSARPVFVDR